jgi:DNA-directed RNA polymerase specialized sigma24 family protein
MPAPRKTIEQDRLTVAAYHKLTQREAAEIQGVSVDTLRRRLREKGSSWEEEKRRLSR